MSPAEFITGLPAIGPIPGAARCFAVMGYGGNGITFAALAAQAPQQNSKEGEEALSP